MFAPSSVAGGGAAAPPAPPLPPPLHAATLIGDCLICELGTFIVKPFNVLGYPVLIFKYALCARLLDPQLVKASLG